MIERRMILAAVALAGCAVSAAEPVRPLDDPGNWHLPDPGAWVWERDGDQPILRLKQQSDFKSDVRRPRNLAWYQPRGWGSFTLTAEVRLDLFNDGNNDLCIAFGQTSETRFYYAHLGQSADGVHLHIHLVDNADRKPITQTRVDTLPWQPGRWHRLVLERDVESGTIRVRFDGVEVLAAEDLTLGEGKIGLGSFDDLGAFRAVEILEGKPGAGGDAAREGMAQP